jgi:hypothetical protein
MDYLARGDVAFPYPQTDIKRELDKLEFRAYPMVHDHKLGSCSGILRFNSYAVSYVPSGDSGDGFTESLNSIFINAEGERLKINYRDRSFRLRVGVAMLSKPSPATHDPDVRRKSSLPALAKTPGSLRQPPSHLKHIETVSEPIALHNTLKGRLQNRMGNK